MEIDPNPSATKAHNPKHGTAATAGDPVDNRPPRSSSDAVPKACCHKMGSRNLIVCIDGTSNQFGKKNTNVIELYNLILKKLSDNQRTWYNSGIGTYARPSWKSFKFYRQVLSHKIDLAIAWNFERTLLGAYRWLSDNYEDGDCIFLFGFSRGAFQVRALSAMIDKVGLIYKGNEMQIPFAYELYADPKSEKVTLTQVGSQQEVSMAERFKTAFSHEDVKVHFVGVWDTVSSIGITRSNYMLPGTIEGMTHVCYFRHALALDERRVKFLPEYAYGGTASKMDDKNVSTLSHGSLHKDNTPSTDSRDVDETLANRSSTKNVDTVDRSDVRPGKESMGKHAHTLEVWFAGTHSDIGGGNAENVGMDRSRPPLRWMVFEAGALGLRMAQFERELSSDEQVEIKESLTWCWWPLEVLPLKRPTYTRQKDGTLFTRKPHLGSSRKIHPGQKIHSSFLLTDKTDAQYTPKARPVNDDSLFWERLRGEGLGEWLELDMYEYTGNVMKGFITAKCQGDKLHVLRQIALSRYGRQAVYEKVIEALKDELELEIKYRLLRSIMDVLRKGPIQDDSHLKLSSSVEIRPLVSDLWESSNKVYQEIAQEFKVRFMDRSLLVLAVGARGVPVAFSPDGLHVASGSSDDTVQIWDAETGKAVGEPFQGHTRSITSVAFSHDGSHVVSGSRDRTVQIWDAETGKPVGEPLEGHADWVRSVAFSPDGSQVASGSDDATVRIWDVQTGKSVGEPFRGHTDWVRSVAFSPDGRHVVSGSDDETAQIWDVETGKLVGEPFQGHTGWVNSVAFSPDGRHLVSGSNDRTIRIWDVETGKPVGEPFQGHSGCINSVAFSPDGSHLVSGSDDETVQVLDVETWKLVGEPFRGHTNCVTSVAFSADGSRLVSGSDDGTVRIWDVTETGEPEFRIAKE